MNTPYRKSRSLPGRCLLPLTICFILNIIGVKLYAESPGVFLVNAATGEEIDDIEFAVYNLHDLPKRLTIEDVYTGFLPPEDVESVKFILNGKVMNIDNRAPYTLKSNRRNKYKRFRFKTGEYTLETQYYSRNRARGEMLGSTTVHFTIINVPPIDFNITPIEAEVAAGEQLTVYFDVNVGRTKIDYELLLDDRYIPSWLAFPEGVHEGTNKAVIIADNLAPGTHRLLNPINLVLQATDIPYAQYEQINAEINVLESDNLLVYGFTLINAQTDQEVYSYVRDGASHPFYNMPELFNIRADVNPAEVGSVKFEYAYQCYTCPMPDLKPLRTENFAPYALFGDRNGDYHGQQIAGGTYYIKATPYSEPNGNGIAGTPKEFQLYIYGAPSNARVTTDSESVTNIYPNPFIEHATIEYQSSKQAQVTIDIYDLKGALVERLYDDRLEASQKISMTFVPESSTAKMYFCRIQNGQSVEVKKLVVGK